MKVSLSRKEQTYGRGFYIELSANESDRRKLMRLMRKAEDEGKWEIEVEVVI